MSWLADKKLTQSAIGAIQTGSVGRAKPRPTNPSASMSCTHSSHPRRRPPGKAKRSNTGAQRNFPVYGSPTKANQPMVAKSTPSSRIQACSTDPVSKSGKPL
ncbi:hypothetical protein JCM13664_01220 [Methylothermus subterraneus]